MSVDMVTRIGLVTQKNQIKEAENFFNLWCVDPGTDVHPVTYSTGKGGCFHSDKAVGAWSWSLSQTTKNNCTFLHFIKLVGDRWICRYWFDWKFQRAKRSIFVAFCDDIWIDCQTSLIIAHYCVYNSWLQMPVLSHNSTVLVYFVLNSNSNIILHSVTEWTSLIRFAT